MLDSENRTVLFYAVAKGHYEAAEVLLRNGAETLLRDKNLRTP